MCSNRRSLIRLEQLQSEAPMYEQGIGGQKGKKVQRHTAPPRCAIRATVAPWLSMFVWGCWQLFSIPFMKKYIMRAKRLEPKLTEAAVEKIAEEYK